MIHSRTYKTPVGALSILAKTSKSATEPRLDLSTVVAAGFATPEQLARRLPNAAPQPVKISAIPALDTAVQGYLEGDGAAFDRIAVEQFGTEFQLLVWKMLRTTEPGSPISYAELAKKIRRPNTTRAVGTACGANLVAPLVPCHRVVRSNGSLGGYYYGIDTKKWLLAHELGVPVTKLT